MLFSSSSMSVCRPGYLRVYNSQGSRLESLVKDRAGARDAVASKKVKYNENCRVLVCFIVCVMPTNYKIVS